MQYRRLFVPILLLLLTLVGISGAVNKKGDTPRLIDTDSTSTFEIAALTDVIPLDTVAVPLYLHTSSLVNYIENRITWTASHLMLISITKGPGVPGDSSVVLDIENQTDSLVQFDLTVNGDAISIPDDQPIVYLNFKVECFGYYNTTYIDLVDDNNYNFYISGGLPLAPLRDNGSIRTARHDWLFVIGDNVTTYSGEKGIAWEVDYRQDVPGRLASAYISYDSNILHFDSLTTAPDLRGGSAWVFDTGDTIAVILFSPTLEHGRQIHLFTLYFSLLNTDDDFTTYLNFVHSSSITECGDSETPSPINGSITVPQHTAYADIGDIQAYNTSTAFIVPFMMNSSFPTNDFEFWVDFPSEDLYFDKIIEVFPFTKPSGDSSGSQLQINNGSGTNYPPSSHPQTVFKLQFLPRRTPAVGDTFHIVFENTPENEVRYLMDTQSYHTANPLTLVDGSIVIKQKPPGGGGGCPTLYTWNGTSFDKDNTILAACAAEYHAEDVSDYYIISNKVVSDDGKLRFQIRESGQETSFFNNFKLMVIDHPANKPIQVTANGKILSLINPIGMKWARDYRGRDITDLVRVRDEVLYTSKESGWIEVSYGKMSQKERDNFTGFASVGLPKPKDRDNDNQARTAGRGTLNFDKKVHVSVRSAKGAWQRLGEINPRTKPTSQATLVDAGQIAPSHELIIRYSWEGYYQVDVVELDRTEPFEGNIIVLDPIEASHDKDGSVLAKLANDNSEDRAKLGPGEVIELVFDGSNLPQVQKGIKRDIIFFAEGRYGASELEGKTKSFALYPNTPNPFNPETSIRYYLPKETHVELKIFDVSGRLVRTLVSGFQPEGEKAVTWNGRSDSGHEVASGVYFYKLQTPEYQMTRKMILLK